MKLERMRDIVDKLKRDDFERATNRSAINALFDGEKPFTEKEASDNHFYTNVQPLMAPRIAQQARQQLSRATTQGKYFFTVKLDLGNADLETFANYQITRLINLPLKRSKAYRHLNRGIDATLFLHGRGPVIWNDDQTWLPTTVGIEDLKMPGGIYTDFSNLSHFAIYQELSAAELWNKIKGNNVQKGWDVERVKMLISQLAEEAITEYRSGDEGYFPEKLALDLKENGTYWSSEKVARARCWKFYELDEVDGKLGWKVYLFTDPADERLERLKKYSMEESFLFKDESGKTQNLCEILQVQYADGCNVAPFRYHSVRGPGYLLYPVMQLFNRLFCRSNDAIMEACNQLFRNVGEADREKLMQVVLGNMSVVPQGVEVVPAQERYTVNHNLLKFGLDLNRQIINENAAAFTAETESGTQKEMTATQVMARVQEASQLVQGIVATKAQFQEDNCKEIARRFTIQGSRDPDVRTFQESVMKLGLPPIVMDFDRWEVRIEGALGGGNKTLEMAQATEMMKARPAYPPKAQQVILRKWHAAVSDDAEEAYELVPPEPQGPTKTVLFANMAIGTLLQSVPVQLDEWIMPDEYAATLVSLLAVKVGGLVQSGVQPSAETVGGIMFTAEHIEATLQAIAQDPAKVPFAKQLAQQLEQILQPVEQWKAAAESDPMAGVPPESRAKVQAMMLEAQTKAQIKQADAAQKMQNLQQRSDFKSAQDKLKLAADLEAKDLEKRQQIAHSEVEFRQQTRHDAVAGALDLANKAAKPKPTNGKGE